MKIFYAPVQGYTDAPYRHFHALTYSPADIYCAPFMHIEHGEPRRRDIRDISTSLNENLQLLPQILFKDFNEFKLLSDAVAGCGYSSVDLNLGCPFPPQVKKGRGAGMITNLPCLNQIAESMNSSADGLSYSIKMRLGTVDARQWREIVPIINDMPLSHVTIHPRVASQQYSGELFMEEFEEALKVLRHPVVFNGDIHTPQDITDMASRYPELYGLMIGRGLLARPSLIEEWRSGTEMDRELQIDRLLSMHTSLLSHYESCLCGDSQILSKIKPFWEYPSEIIGHRSAKLIRKAGSLNSYNNAVSTIGSL